MAAHQRRARRLQTSRRSGGRRQAGRGARRSSSTKRNSKSSGTGRSQRSGIWTASWRRYSTWSPRTHTSRYWPITASCSAKKDTSAMGRSSTRRCSKFHSWKESCDEAGVRSTGRMAVLLGRWSRGSRGVLQCTLRGASAIPQILLSYIGPGRRLRISRLVSRAARRRSSYVLSLCSGRSGCSGGCLRGRNSPQRAGSRS